MLVASPSWVRDVNVGRGFGEGRHTILSGRAVLVELAGDGRARKPSGNAKTV